MIPATRVARVSAILERSALRASHCSCLIHTPRLLLSWQTLTLSCRPRPLSSASPSRRDRQQLPHLPRRRTKAGTTPIKNFENLSTNPKHPTPEKLYSPHSEPRTTSPLPTSNLGSPFVTPSTRFVTQLIGRRVKGRRAHCVIVYCGSHNFRFQIVSVSACQIFSRLLSPISWSVAPPFHFVAANVALKNS